MCDGGLQMDNKLFRLRGKFCPLPWSDFQCSESGAIGSGNGSVAWVDLGGWGVFKETGM